MSDPVRRALGLPPTVVHDPARPWLAAGASHLAAADAHEAHHRTTAGPVARLSTPPIVHELRRRAHACQQAGRTLDGLLVDGWHVLHDRHAVGERGTVDHVLFGPAGLALVLTTPTVDIDQHRYPGPVTVANLNRAAVTLQQVLAPATIAALSAALTTDVAVPVHSLGLHVGKARPYDDFGHALTPHQVRDWLSTRPAPLDPLLIETLLPDVVAALPPATAGHGPASVSDLTGP